jgi:porphobilinogen synthase
LSPAGLILPLFVDEGLSEKKPVGSMPGVYRLPVSDVAAHAREARDLGLGGLIFFGIPGTKDEKASGAYAADGIVQKAIREAKNAAGDDLVVMADTCLCEYTSHGHCGVVKGDEILNDETLELLAKAAVSQADAGADVIAPSDMMDGRVGAIRAALDDAGHSGRTILSYAAKYASAFYGPFRDAADSTPAFGDRRTHQMDPANGREALKEVALDLEEGADAVMVKPALPYLDVISEVRRLFNVPVAAYHVSGEFAMLKAAGDKGWLDADRCMMESLISIGRAGADVILTYWAREAAKLV